MGGVFVFITLIYLSLAFFLGWRLGDALACSDVAMVIFYSGLIILSAGGMAAVLSQL